MVICRIIIYLNEPWKRLLAILHKGVIIGTSSVAHTEQNLKAVEQGPLPEHVLDALNAAWEVAMVKCPPYYR